MVDPVPPCVFPPSKAVVLGILTGVELEEQLDSVVIEVAAVQDHLDEWGKTALPCCCH